MMVAMIRDAATILFFAVLLGACSDADSPLDPNDPSEEASTHGDDDQQGGDGDSGPSDADASDVDPTDDDQGDGDAPGDTDAPEFCNALDAQQDRCGAWTERDKREACDMGDDQAECITDVLIELESRGTSSCVYPHAMKAVCIGGQITNIGVAKCFIEECLELTTADACLGNLQILCGYLP